MAFLQTFSIEPRWLVLCLTLVGGMNFWFGVRRQQFFLRLFGLVIQLVSLYIFLSSVWYPFSASLVKNSYFLSCLFIAFIALYSAFCIEKQMIGVMKVRDRVLAALLLLLGIGAWYVGGLREIYMHIVLLERLSGILLFIAATSILLGLLAETTHWEKLNLLLLVQLPVMVLLLFFELSRGFGEYSLLTGWGTTVWPITFFIQYRVLQVLDGLDWRRVGVVYHLVSLWLLFFFCNRELVLWLASTSSISPQYIQIMPSLLAFIFIVALLVMKKISCWPVRMFPAVYLLGGSGGILTLLLVSML